MDLISSSSLENRVQQWLSAINPLPVTISSLGVESSHKAGLLWDFGKFARSHFDDGHPWAADLEVDDVSYCDQAAEVEGPAAACGPGYAHLNNDVPTGVRPYLYLKFTLTALTAIGQKSGVVFTLGFCGAVQRHGMAEGPVRAQAYVVAPKPSLCSGSQAYVVAPKSMGRLQGTVPYRALIGPGPGPSAAPSVPGRKRSSTSWRTMLTKPGLVVTVRPARSGRHGRRPWPPPQRRGRGLSPCCRTQTR